MKKMKSADFPLPSKSSLIHAAIGGGICFFAVTILLDVAYGGLIRSLISLNVIGVMVFTEQFTLARNIFLFGVVYLSSGYCGGLYTGYQVEEEDLKIVLAVCGVVGFVAFLVLYYFLGYLELSSLDVLGQVIFPLVGCVAGSYLGGYTLNWPSPEEGPVESEELRLELGE